MAKAEKAKVTIPTIVQAAVEPPAQTKVWIERRTRGEYAAGVTVVNDNVDLALVKAKDIFTQLLLYIEGAKRGEPS
jgi:hypothetical protein